MYRKMELIDEVKSAIDDGIMDTFLSHLTDHQMSQLKDVIVDDPFPSKIWKIRLQQKFNQMIDIRSFKNGSTMERVYYVMNCDDDDDEIIRIACALPSHYKTRRYIDRWWIRKKCTHKEAFIKCWRAKDLKLFWTFVTIDERELTLDDYFELLEELSYDYCALIAFRRATIQLAYDRIAKLKNINAILAILDLRPSMLKYVIDLIEDPTIAKTINNPDMFDSTYIVDLMNSL